jgi:hypothetical protein
MHTAFISVVTGNHCPYTNNEKGDVKKKNCPFSPCYKFVFENTSNNIDAEYKQQNLEPPGIVNENFCSSGTIIVFDKGGVTNCYCKNYHKNSGKKHGK